VSSDDLVKADWKRNALNWNKVKEALTPMRNNPSTPEPTIAGRDYSAWYSRSIFMVLLLTLMAAPVEAARRPYIPPPLRVYVPFESCWDGIHEVLKIRQFELIQQDRGRGLIVTDYKEYISGPLTASHIAKIGTRPELPDGNWLRVQYQFETLVELVSARETVVTVNANVRALKRDFFGKEEWVDIPTNGELESGLLTDFGKLLFGTNFELTKPKPGFWERDPTYVPEEMERIPRIAGPERP